MLNQTSDGRHDLLSNVPLLVELELSLLREKLLRAEGLVTEMDILLLLLVLAFNFADNVWDEVVDQVCVTLALQLLSNGHLDMREGLYVAVMFRGARQLLRDDVLVDHQLRVFHLLTDAGEELVETEHDVFSLLVAQNFLEHEVADSL